MRRAVPLRDSVISAFARILAHAGSAARRARVEPTEAVHEFRKSVRRARALVSLLRPALGRRAAAGIASELQRAFAATGPLRDADILLATLRSLTSDDPAIAAIEEHLQQEAGGQGPAEVLEAGSKILRPLPDTLRVTLPRDFSMEDLARGLARAHRRQRRAFRRAAESGSTADFHGWRKRVKELRYQVEMLASTGSARVKRREAELADLADDLGRVTDLIVLESELAQRRERGAIPDAPALFDTLTRTIAESSLALLARGRKDATETPGDFARRVLAERG